MYKVVRLRCIDALDAFFIYLIYYWLMAKFEQKVVKPTTAKEKEAQRKAMKESFAEYKNPFASQNPFRDGEDLVFESIVEVQWSHKDYGSGKYIALAFVGKEPTISLTSFLKEIKGYANYEIRADDKAQDFKNEGGFAEWLSTQVWDSSILEEIEKWFAKGKRANKCKIKLTEYYTPLGSSRKKNTLTNLI